MSPTASTARALWTRVSSRRFPIKLFAFAFRAVFAGFGRRFFRLHSVPLLTPTIVSSSPAFGGLAARLGRDPLRPDPLRPLNEHNRTGKEVAATLLYAKTGECEARPGKWPIGGYQIGVEIIDLGASCANISAQLDQIVSDYFGVEKMI